MPPINSRSLGSGPDVLLIHGFCEHLEMWSDIQSALSNEYTVHTIDLPGFGKSPLPENNFTIAEIGTEVLEWLEETSIQKAVILGHSLGGYVGLEMLKQRPKQLSGLGLIHSTAFADNEETIEKRQKALTFLDKHPIEKFIGPFVPSLFNLKRRSDFEKGLQKAIDIANSTKKETAIAYTLAMKNRTDHFKLWENTNTPLLFIGGTHDSRVPYDIAIKHIESGHHVTGHILQGIGHMGMYESPAETLQILKDYLLKVC